ncbi:MAG: hypothetical protein KKA90_01690 [Nanoarchaeota archaeon]|nr:hypothetical protein [Nanoarchaeota archaeon]
MRGKIPLLILAAIIIGIFLSFFLETAVQEHPNLGSPTSLSGEPGTQNETGTEGQNEAGQDQDNTATATGAENSETGNDQAMTETNETEDEPLSCTPQYTETIANGSTTFVNYDCENPLPVCDPTGVCRTCTSVLECIRTSEGTFVTGTENQEFVWQNFMGIGTSFTASHNSMLNFCTVKEGGEIIQSGEFSPEACKQLLAGYLTCIDGVCGST